MAKSEIKKDTIKEFYDKRYEGTYREEQKGLELYRVKYTLNEIPTSIKTILDYGCGQGGWIKVLSNKFPNAEICGIDISDKAVERAMIKFPQHDFLSFDGDTAPFEDNSFELIYSYHVLEHVYDIQKTIFDISRLLKKGGYLCIIFPCGNENSFEERITCLVQGGKEISTDGEKRFFYEDSGHIRRMKSEEVIESFAQHNIGICKELYASQFWGAIEWIGKSGPVFISEFFNNKRGVNTSAKIKLLLLKIIFLTLTNPVRLYKANLRKYIKSSRSMMRKMILAMLIPFKIIVIPFGLVIDFFSLLEWRFFKTQKNGSAQYLIFKKG